METTSANGWVLGTEVATGSSPPLVDVEGNNNLKRRSAPPEFFVAHAVISLVLALLLAVAAAGGLVPAVRAARTRAIAALRSE